MDKPTEKNKSKRAKGGAEKSRDRKKKRLLDEGKHCQKIDQLFVNTNKTKIDGNNPVYPVITEITGTSTGGACDQLDQRPQGRLAVLAHNNKINILLHNIENLSIINKIIES